MWGARQCGGRYAHHTLAASRFCLASVINHLADSTARTEQPPEAQRVDRGGWAWSTYLPPVRTVGETRLQGWAMCILPATALPLPQIAIATAKPFSIPLFQQTDPRPAWCMYSISVWGVGACRSPFGLPYIRTASLQHTPPETSAERVPIPRRQPEASSASPFLPYLHNLLLNINITACCGRSMPAVSIRPARTRGCCCHRLNIQT